uniref:Uncharacterized protein n=1 Tax=Anopheles dirus TaxID=7168 RepID=A0A182NYH4_9DIPT
MILVVVPTTSFVLTIILSIVSTAVPTITITRFAPASSTSTLITVIYPTVSGGTTIAITISIMATTFPVSFSFPIAFPVTLTISLTILFAITLTVSIAATLTIPSSVSFAITLFLPVLTISVARVVSLVLTAIAFRWGRSPSIMLLLCFQRALTAARDAG